MVGLLVSRTTFSGYLRSDLIRIGPHKKDWGQRCLVRVSILPNFIRRTTADQRVDRSLGRLWLSSHAKETDRLFVRNPRQSGHPIRSKAATLLIG